MSQLIIFLEWLITRQEGRQGCSSTLGTTVFKCKLVSFNFSCPLLFVCLLHLIIENMAAAVLEFVSYIFILQKKKKRERLVLRYYQFCIQNFQFRCAFSGQVSGFIQIGRLRWKYVSSPITMRYDGYTQEKGVLSSKSCRCLLYSILYPRDIYSICYILQIAIVVENEFHVPNTQFYNKSLEYTH